MTELGLPEWAALATIGSFLLLLFKSVRTGARRAAQRASGTAHRAALAMWEPARKRLAKRSLLQMTPAAVSALTERVSRLEDDRDHLERYCGHLETALFLALHVLNKELNWQEQLETGTGTHGVTKNWMTPRPTRPDGLNDDS